MPLAGEISWGPVDAFLRQRQREGRRIEYRERFSGTEAPVERTRHPRTVDTIAAMANSGGGLILIGVAAAEADIPTRWGHVPPGSNQPAAIESACRNHLDPHVPLAIGIARSPEGSGEVVVVRVDDHPEKPVLVADRGILVRIGQETVHAGLPEIRAWLSASDVDRQALANAVAMHIAGEPPENPPARLTVAIGPARTWTARRWGDEVDSLAAIRLASTHSPAQMEIAESAVQWQWRADGPIYERTLSLTARPTILQSSGIERAQDDRTDLVDVASELARAWRFAQLVIPEVLVGYIGDLHLAVSLGATRSGFRSRARSSALEDIPANPARLRGSWKGTFTLPRDADMLAMLQALLTPLTRAVGYSGIAHELMMIAAQVEDETGKEW
jgi:hypothetical protein